MAWRSLTWQLVFITILPLTVLVLAIAFGSLNIHQSAMRTLVGERDERAVRMAAAALEEQLIHRSFAIRNLALLVEGVEPPQIATRLSSSEYLLPEFDGGLAVFDRQGELVGSLGDEALWRDVSIRMSSTVRTLVTASPSRPFWSGSFPHPLSGKALVLILAPAAGGEWVAGGLFAADEMVRHTLTSAFASGSEASVAVVSAEGRLLYAGGTFSYSGEIAKHPGIAEALGGESGTQYMRVAEGEHVVAYSPVAPLGWALVFEEPWDMVASPTLRASQLAPLVLVPVLLLAVVVLWLGARRIVRPLQALEAKAATLAWGDFKAIEEPVGGIEEIRQLQTELIHMAGKVQAAQQSLHGYIGAITAAQEEERCRLARELHDDTIQALIALKQRVQLAQMAAPSNVPDAAALEEIAILIEQTIENLRRLTRALRPIYLEDLGLVPALEMLARETGQALNIPVDFQRQGVERRLEPAGELALYRMAQEAFSNISRHALASRASLAINFWPDRVVITIADNGKGFAVPKSPAEFAAGGHYGLLGLHERAELIGASLEIVSTPGTGTCVTVKLSVPPDIKKSHG